MSSEDAAAKPGLRVVAIRSACCGYGVCSEICPEIFGLDDNGIVIVKTEFVPPGLESKAREGAQACPQSALTVEEIP